MNQVYTMPAATNADQVLRNLQDGISRLNQVSQLATELLGSIRGVSEATARAAAATAQAAAAQSKQVEEQGRILELTLAVVEKMREVQDRVLAPAAEDRRAAGSEPAPDAKTKELTRMELLFESLLALGDEYTWGDIKAQIKGRNGEAARAWDSHHDRVLPKFYLKNLGIIQESGGLSLYRLTDYYRKHPGKAIERIQASTRIQRMRPAR